MNKRILLNGLLCAVLIANPTFIFASQDKKPASQNPAPAQPNPGQSQAPPPTPPSPGAEKPFVDIIKDAEVIKGLFTLYRKDDKVYIEILPDQFDKIYQCSPTLDSGLGERGIYAAQMLDDFVFTFHQLGKNVQFINKNVRYRADANTPMGRAVARSFTDSILGAAPRASLPHPERKSILVELNPIFLTDIPLLGYMLEATYRLPYRLDAKNSAFEKVKAFPQNIEIESLLNFTIERPSVPPLMPSPVPIPQVPPPLTPPDLRSLQFRVRYSLSLLPAGDFMPRLADDRVGHFLTMHHNLTDDINETPYVRYVNRWKLEKADPNAALSVPKEPIVFWLENTVPEKYRKAITEGTLLWNRAFERIGFKDAVVVKQQSDDADWDPADSRYNTIRWIANTDSGFAQGPSRTNPFTGQIYDADIRFSDSMTRFSRITYDDEIVPLAEQTIKIDSILNARIDPGKLCNISSGATLQADFGYNLIEARGSLGDGMDKEKFIHDFLVSIAAHEVGHTLGLRHNFRASTINSFDKLQDTSITADRGLTGSVMDYIPVNIAPKGTKQGSYWQTILGTYDYWAIEYAYKPLAASKPEDELSDLKKIASRVADPLLAYATDEDSFGNSHIGIDPRSNQWDYGEDPLKYYTERIKLSLELVDDVETKIPRNGEGYQRLRRAFNIALGERARSLLNANKYIGGIYSHRDHVGDPNGRIPYEPVPAAKQKEALELLKKYAFGPQAFEFKPSLLNKLAMDRFEDFEGTAFRAQRLDYPIHLQVVSWQRILLDRLYNPIVLSRLLDSEIKYSNPKDAFTMADMFEGVQEAIWFDLKPGTVGQINSFRRAVQREHLKRLSRILTRVDNNTPEDAVTLARYGLTQLRGRIQTALSAPGVGGNVIVKAHLQESLARIDETLKAQQTRMIN